jgi:hypothetical protein
LEKFLAIFFNRSKSYENHTKTTQKPQKNKNPAKPAKTTKATKTTKLQINQGHSMKIST